MFADQREKRRFASAAPGRCVGECGWSGRGHSVVERCSPIGRRRAGWMVLVWAGLAIFTSASSAIWRRTARTGDFNQWPARTGDVRSRCSARG